MNRQQNFRPIYTRWFSITRIYFLFLLPLPPPLPSPTPFSTSLPSQLNPRSQLSPRIFMPCAAILNRRFPEIFARREIATLFSFDVPFFRDKRNTGEEGEPGSDQDHEQGFYTRDTGKYRSDSWKRALYSPLNFRMMDECMLRVII